MRSGHLRGNHRTESLDTCDKINDAMQASKLKPCVHMRPKYIRYDTTMNIKSTITNPRNCKVLTGATKRFLTIGFCGCRPSNKWPNSARGWRNRIRSQRRKGFLSPETDTIWGEITSTPRQSSKYFETGTCCNGPETFRWAMPLHLARPTSNRG